MNMNLFAHGSIDIYPLIHITSTSFIYDLCIKHRPRQDFHSTSHSARLLYEYENINNNNHHHNNDANLREFKNVRILRDRIKPWKISWNKSFGTYIYIYFYYTTVSGLCIQWK